MTITFLGTGTSQGIPVIGCSCKVCTSSHSKDKRLRCASYIQSANGKILIDSGPDIRQQLLRSTINHIDAALLTHEHYDHTGGLDDLRPLGFMNNGIQLYAKYDVLAMIKLKYDYAFGEQKYPGAPKFHLHEIQPSLPFSINDFSILPITVFHGELAIVGYIFNQRLAYITDANGFPPESIQALRNIDTIVINALHHQDHHSHFTLAQTLAILKEINPSRAYLIHMSHYMGLHDEVEKSLPEYVRLAYDGLQLTLD